MSDLEKIRQYYADVDQSTSTHDKVFEVHSDAVERIIALFAENGIYDRQNAAHEGKQAIKEFFSKTRSLCGSHKITSIEACNGMASQDSIRIDLQKIPNRAECETILVKGRFSGILFVTSDNEEAREIKQTHSAELDFDDYWILHKGKVVYRQSDIFPIRREIAPVEGLRY